MNFANLPPRTLVVIDEDKNLHEDVYHLQEQFGNLSGINTRSLQTNYDSNGNLIQAKELDSSNNTIIETDITYNSDGTVHTLTEIQNGKTVITTLNYVNGALDHVNPFTRSVS